MSILNLHVEVWLIACLAQPKSARILFWTFKSTSSRRISESSVHLINRNEFCSDANTLASNSPFPVSENDCGFSSQQISPKQIPDGVSVLFCCWNAALLVVMHILLTGKLTLIKKIKSIKKLEKLRFHHIQSLVCVNTYICHNYRRDVITAIAIGNTYSADVLINNLRYCDLDELTPYVDKCSN